MLSLNVAAADLTAVETPLLVLALPSSPTLPSEAAGLDGTLGGALGRAISRRDFRGGRDEVLHLAGGDRGVQRVLLVGMGKLGDRTNALRRAGAIAGRQASRMGVGKLAFFAGALSAAEVEAAALGIVAGAWDFKETKTAPPADEQRAPLEAATVIASDRAAAERGVAAARAIGEGHSLARRLGMLPGNICTPEYLEGVARDMANRFGMTLTVLNRADMEKEKMGSFLCVAQGTPQEPKLIAL